MDEIVCNECGLRYEVVWSNDGQEAPTDFCPRCGSQNLTLPKPSE
jgi:rRNA maturation endonuclease Nob1